MNKFDNPRYIVLLCLIKLNQSDGYSNLTLNNMLKKYNFNSREKKFISALYYGVIEKKITLDYIISQYSKIKVKKLDIQILEILRMGFFQFIYMNSIPENAIVNESVSLAKLIGKKYSSGFVNAVLRNFIRNNRQYKLPKAIDKNYRKVKYSCSDEILRILIDSYGNDTTDLILENIDRKPKLVIRVNTLKITEDELVDEFSYQGVKAYKTELKNALVIENIGSIDENKLFKNGLFYVQSLSSQLCCSVVNAEPNDVVFDVCAAPGGKTFTISQDMQNKGNFYAFDVYDHRVKLLEDSAKTLSVNIVKTFCQDSTKLNPEKYPKADKVLCDVPCSGLGVMKKKPEIKYKKLENLEELLTTQYDILLSASRLLKTGGKLIYSTCTLNIKENNAMIYKFLRKNKNFEAVDIKVPSFVNRNSFEPASELTIFPDECFDDGFFIAQLRKIR